MKNQEKAQQLYYELQLVEQRIQQVQQQIQILHQQSAEIEAVKQNLTETGKVKKGNTVLVPLANGIFAKAKIEDTENLIVNVGAGAVVMKNLEDTKQMLTEQITEAKRVRTKLGQELEEKAHQFNEKQRELQKLMK